MRHLITTLSLLLLLIAPGFATEGYSSYEAEGFGFKLDLPTTGQIQNPATEGWAEDPETAFVWYSEADEPIWSIDGTAYEIEEPVSAEMLETFMVSFAEGFVGYMHDVEIGCELLAADDGYEFAGRTWYGTDFSLNFGEEDEGITAFGTAEGSKIYLLMFSYTGTLSEDVQAYGKPVLDSFAVSEQKH